MTTQMEIDNMTSKTVQYVSTRNPDFIVEANYEMDVSQCVNHACFITQYFLDDKQLVREFSEHHYDMKIEEVDGRLHLTTFNDVLIETDTILKIMEEFRDMVKKVNDYFDEPYL
jgi:hypothetical protein